jgi:hypothetical protein
MSVRSVGIIGAGQAGFQTAASLRQSARPEAPTKDRLIGKIMGGNPAFRGTRVPVHLLAELVPRACARARANGGEVLAGRGLEGVVDAWTSLVARTPF